MKHLEVEIDVMFLKGVMAQYADILFICSVLSLVILVLTFVNAVLLEVTLGMSTVHAVMNRVHYAVEGFMKVARLVPRLP